MYMAIQLRMRREGQIIKNRKLTGFKEEWHDELFYGILYEEWIKIKQAHKEK